MKRVLLDTAIVGIGWNRCDVCGKFIGFTDLESGAACRVMISPDSDCSQETYDTLCRDHRREVIHDSCRGEWAKHS